MKVEIDIKDLVDLCREFQTNIGEDADEAYIRMWLDKNNNEYIDTLNKLAEDIGGCRRDIDKLWRKIK